MDLRVALLALLFLTLPLSGCVGETDVIGDASATDEAVGTDSSSSDNLDAAYNHPPVLAASISTELTDIQGQDCTTNGVQFQARHAMVDWNDNISRAGWDTNLDGVIDVPVSSAEGYTTLQLLFTNMVMATVTNQGSNSVDYVYAEGSVVFGAQDESGAWSSSELLQVRKLLSYSYFNNGQAITYSYVDTEPCADFDDVRDYNFTVTDHADFASDGSTDYLVTISRSNGATGINWNRVRIYFEGSDEGNELCTTTSRCQLLDGDGLQNTTSLGSMWDAGQSITIKEDDNNFHRAGYTAGVTIYIDNVLVFDEEIMLN